MDTTNESVVADHAQNLLRSACHFGASDIHIMPTMTHYEVKFRQFGQLRAHCSYPAAFGSKIISYFKFLSAIDIGERRKPQSGAFSQQLFKRNYAFRISTLPSIHQKESVVIRIVEQRPMMTLSDLLLFKEHATHLQKILQATQGLILFSGATGTGKSTTLYACMRYCQEQLNRYVISLEDPVESVQPNMLQVQINEKAGITYANGLRAILRHTPDVILIGEIRDAETAAIAIEAALTGHLVCATIHAKDPFNCLYRLLDLQVSLPKLKQTVIAIIAQTLQFIQATNNQKAILQLADEPELQQYFQRIEQRQIPRIKGTSYVRT